jgi:hypothetical protein
MYSDTEIDDLDVLDFLVAQDDLSRMGDSPRPSNNPALDVMSHSPPLEDVNIPDSPGSICILPDDFDIPDIPNSREDIAEGPQLDVDIPDSPGSVCMLPDDFYIPDIPNHCPLSPNDIPPPLNPYTILDFPNDVPPCPLSIADLPEISNAQPEQGSSRGETQRQHESAAERSLKTLKTNLIQYLPVLLTRTSLLRAQLAQLIMERDMTSGYLDGAVTKILEMDRYLHGLRALQLIRGEGVHDEEARV